MCSAARRWRKELDVCQKCTWVQKALMAGTVSGEECVGLDSALGFFKRGVLRGELSAVLV